MRALRVCIHLLHLPSVERRLSRSEHIQLIIITTKNIFLLIKIFDEEKCCSDDAQTLEINNLWTITLSDRVEKIE